MAKEPFDIDTVMERVEEATRELPKAALFELAGDGYDTPFQQVVACMISVRTRDETTLPLARRLFERASTPEDMSRLGEDEIAEIIDSASFSETKVGRIREIARRVVDEFGGEAPCDEETLQSFPGIGPKCANLVLGIACDEPRISVDVHVHRVTNRWGYVDAGSPDQTLRALEDTLPYRYWTDINRLLVPFGKHVCTGRRPHCSTCPVLAMCRQIGVTDHR